MRENDVAHLHPAYRGKSLLLQARLAQRSVPIRRYEAWRDPFRQSDLFAFGRALGVGVPGRHKTFERAWQSSHQWGFADDWVWWINLSWTWTPPAGRSWDELDEAVAYVGGIETLKFERPHVQLAGFNARRALAGDRALLADGDPLWEKNLEDAAARWGVRDVKDRYGIVHPAAPVLDDRPAISVPPGMVYDAERGLCVPEDLADDSTA